MSLPTSQAGTVYYDTRFEYMLFQVDINAHVSVHLLKKMLHAIGVRL